MPLSGGTALPRALLLLTTLLSLGVHGRHIRELLGSESAVTIYKDGLNSAWTNWSWGLKSLSIQDSGSLMPDSKYSFCATIGAYGAISLKSNSPFSLDGVLSMYMHGNNTAGTASMPFNLSSLELQFESSAPSSYTISRSYTLGQLAAKEGTIDGKGPVSRMVNIKNGGWEPFNIQMASFAPNGTASAQYDRITLGSCLQKFELCTGQKVPDIYLCLENVIMS